MQNIVSMHTLNAKRNLIKGPAHKVLRKSTLSAFHKIAESIAFHELKNNPDSILEIKDVLAANQLIAVCFIHEMHGQTALIDYAYSFDSILRVCEFQREEFAVWNAHRLKDSSKTTLTKLANYLIKDRWVHAF